MSGFLRDTAKYGVAVGVDRVIGLVLLPLLTGGLDKEGFGIWTQVHISYGFFSTILLLGFYYTISDLVSGRPLRQRENIFAGVLSLVVVAIAVVALLCALAPDAISRILFGDTRHRDVVGVLAFFVATESLFELVVLTFLRAQGQISLCALYYGLKSICRLLVVIVGVGVGASVPKMLVAIGLFNGVLVLFVAWHDVFVGGMPVPFRGFGVRFWRHALRSGLTAAAAVLVAWTNLTLSRFMIVHFSGLEDVAVYAGNFSILNIVTIVSMILGFTLLHHAGAAVKAGDRKRARRVLRDAVTYYFYAAAPLVLVLVVLYRDVAQLLLPASYVVGYFLPVSLGMFFLVFGIEQLLVFVMLPGGGGGALQWRIVGLFVNAAAGSLLIPRFGVTWGAVPPLMGSCVVVVACGAIARKRIGFRFPWQAAAKMMAAVGAMAVVGSTVRNLWNGGPNGAVVIGGILMGLTYVAVESAWRRSVTRMTARYVFGRMLGG